MGIGFIYNDRIILSADLRGTEIDAITGANTGKQFNDKHKLIKLGSSGAAFIGGLDDVYTPSKKEIENTYMNKKSLATKDLALIKEICLKHHNNFISRVGLPDWLKDTKTGTVTVIAAIYDHKLNKPIIWTMGDNFIPVLYDQNYCLTHKSCIDDEHANRLILEINNKIASKGHFEPLQFIDDIFKAASEFDNRISYKHDMLIVNSKGIAKSLYEGCSKPLYYKSSSNTTQMNVVNTGYINALGVTANYVKAGVSIESPYITGASINGGTITGGSITSNSTINVTTNATVGSSISVGESLIFRASSGSGGIRWGTEVFAPQIYYDGGGSLNLYNNGPIYANGHRIDMDYASLYHSHSEYASYSHSHSGYMQTYTGGAISVTESGIVVFEPDGTPHNIFYG